MVRDKLRFGKKNVTDEEQVTIIFIDIYKFDDIVKSFSATELLNFLDSLFNQFDQLCD